MTSSAAPTVLARLTQLPAFLTWLLLIGLTLFSWWLGDGHGPGRLATVAVLAFAFFKVGVVGANFMELRHAPLPLRLIFNTWTAVVCAVLITIYLFF